MASEEVVGDRAAPIAAVSSRQSFRALMKVVRIVFARTRNKAALMTTSGNIRFKSVPTIVPARHSGTVAKTMSGSTMCSSGCRHCQARL